MRIDSNDSCWVYIQKIKNRTFRVELAVDIERRISGLNSSCSIIYCKQFSSTISALGHKLLLDQLSNSSLLRIIKKENPELTNLRDTLTFELPEYKEKQSK